MFVVKPAPTEAARPLSSFEAPVPIDIDSDDDSSSSSSDGGDTDDLVEEHQKGDVDADIVEGLTEAPEQAQEQPQQQLQRRGALTVETGVPARSAHSHSPSPVSRLNGYKAAADTTATGSTATDDASMLESTGSSPSKGQRRGRTINAEFFKSLRKDFPPRTPPKASLKRPLSLQIERRKNGPIVAVAVAAAEEKKPVVRNSNLHGYKSSSDSGDVDVDVDDEDVVVEEQETKREEYIDEDSDGEHRDVIAPATKKPKPDAPEPLNFFMRKSQEPFTTDLRSPDTMLLQRQQQSQHNRICSSRTRICGQVYGRCELTFSDRSVELVLWRRQEGPEKRIWQGTLKYTHLQRFCFYRGERLPPYLLLMEIRTSEEVNTLFSEFYDSIFAKFAQERKEVPKPNLYGAAFYFDEDVDFVRCQSMAESFPALNELFDVQIPKDEAVEYFDSEVNGGDGNRSSTVVLRERRRSSLVSTLAGGVKNAVNAVSSYFGSGGQQSSAHATMEKSNSSVVKSDKGRNDQSIVKFFQKGNQEAVVEIDDPSQASFGDESEEKMPIGAVEREHRNDGAEMLTESQVRDAAIQALEARRSTTLLTYPYEDSESAGKISVTYGDIARLAPGEFLNDNIIDFYLRFYWRHLEPWRQEEMYFYSSHFFTQLNGNGANLTAEERFARVSRWTQKEGNLFMKRFLFIPINDSFHWSVAVFCNPGSAITQKRRRIRQVVVSKNGEVSARRPISVDSDGEPMIVDLATDNFSQFRLNNDDDGDDRSPDRRGTAAAGNNNAQQECDEVREEYYEEDLDIHIKYRKEHPPCLLFLDSLKCHRKKKFTAMLREYLDSEWKNRHGSANEDSIPTGIDDESIVMYFEPESITLLEPDMPMQTNSSDCGVFLLMYAAEVARRFPAGITQEDVETEFSATLTSEMFDLSHVQEFRDYLHQLIFCLHSLQKRGLSEEHVKDEELDMYISTFLYVVLPAHRLSKNPRAFTNSRTFTHAFNNLKQRSATSSETAPQTKKNTTKICSFLISREPASFCAARPFIAFTRPRASVWWPLRLLSMSESREMRQESPSTHTSGNGTTVMNADSGCAQMKMNTKDLVDDTRSLACSPSSVSSPVSKSTGTAADGRHDCFDSSHRRSSTSSSDTAENVAPVMPISHSAGDLSSSQVDVKAHAHPHIPPLNFEKLNSKSSDSQKMALPQALPPSQIQSPAVLSSVSPSSAVYNAFSFEEVMSPRHQNGKRYLGGYLQHRVSMAGGFLKSWKRKYFRLRDHGIVCYKDREDSSPLFEITFKAHSMLLLGKLNGDSNSSASGSSANKSVDRHDPGANESSVPVTSSGKVNGSLLFILKHVEIVGHQTPVGKVEVPLYLKAESRNDYTNWIECLRLKMEARKRALAQSTVHAVVSGSSNSRIDSYTAERSTRAASESGVIDQEQAESTMTMKKSGAGQSQSSFASPAKAKPLRHSESQQQKDSNAKATKYDPTASADPLEFAQFQNKYLLMKEIGEGSFSIVHKAVNRLTGQLCAVKCCKYSTALEEEVSIMRKLSHPNIVGVESVYHQDNMYFVVMDFMEDGDLCDRLIQRQKLPENEVQVIISQVLQGLEYLHRHNILHRDIKPENILLHGDAVKIADFGLAKQLPNATSMLKRSCGTLEYAAPELLVGQPYGLKSDIFSLGVVLYVLLFGAFPFSIESAAALQCMERFPEGIDVRDMSCLSRENIQWRSVSQQAQDVILKMLAPREKDRVSARDLLVHPWFDPARTSSTASLGAVQPSLHRGSNTWKVLEMNAAGQECVRLADCEVKGFKELLGRGLEVTKYGNKGSTAPHATTVSIDFPQQMLSWTARPGPLTTSSSRKQGAGRSIRLCDITEVRLGHATDAFTYAVKGKDAPSPELCISIVCSWRTLDLVVKAVSQREFLSKGLLRLINGGSLKG